MNVHFYYQLAMLTHGVRRAGAAAPDLDYVACGRLDLFWEFSLEPWDMAAGTLLVREAGGLVTDMRGGAFDLHSLHLLADYGLVHAETLELFRRDLLRPVPDAASAGQCLAPAARLRLTQPRRADAPPSFKWLPDSSPQEDREC